MSLSERLRPDVECAQWVIDEVKGLEAEVKQLKKLCAEAARRTLPESAEGCDLVARLKAAGQEQEADPRVHPCDTCGKLRTKAEGGTVFTLCDECWNRRHPNRGG